MNKDRRALLCEAERLLEKVCDIVERSLDDEQNAYDNLPEGIQDGDRGEKMENAISKLEEAIDLIESAKECIEEAQE